MRKRTDGDDGTGTTGRSARNGSDLRLFADRIDPEETS